MILELGAGAGLLGLVASQFCKQLLMTDNQQVVLDLMTKNLKFAKKNNVIVKSFSWGQEQAMMLEQELQIGKIDMIIGSDIIFWPASVNPLVKIINLDYDTQIFL